jgi:xylulokinase
MGNEDVGVAMYLGVDLGTSSVKVVAVDERQRVAAQSSAALNIKRPEPLWSEQDPEDWWRATVTAIRTLPAEIRQAVRSIGLSGQMHGAVLLDPSDRVLRPAILWNDGRSGAESSELERREPRSREITGNLAMPGFTAPKLLWVKRHEPETFARTRTVLLPKDYIRLRLTGEKISDMSDAAGTLWLDVRRRVWSDAMLDATHLKRSHMPGLVEGTEAAGQLRTEIASLLGMDPVNVAGGAGDNAASAVGTGVVASGQAFLSLGTSGVLFVVTDEFRPAPEQAAHAFCHAVPQTWHQMSVMLSAASAVDWAIQITGMSDVHAALQAAESRGLGPETPIFLPYLSGERTPHNDPFARGVFFGLTSTTTGADLIVSVLAGVALGLADGLDTLAHAGSNIEAISLVGGAARFDYWALLIASTLNRPLLRHSGGEIGAAFGAASLGRAAVTHEDPVALFTGPPVDRIVAPDHSMVALLRERRATYISLYAQIKHLFRS